MALALLGRGSLHSLTTWGENLGVRAHPGVVRECKLPRPKRGRAISVSEGKGAVQAPMPSKGNQSQRLC